MPSGPRKKSDTVERVKDFITTLAEQTFKKCMKFHVTVATDGALVHVAEDEPECFAVDCVITGLANLDLTVHEEKYMNDL